MNINFEFYLMKQKWNKCNIQKQKFAQQKFLKMNFYKSNAYKT